MESVSSALACLICPETTGAHEIRPGSGTPSIPMMVEPFRTLPTKTKISSALAVLVYLTGAALAIPASRLVAVLGLIVIFASAGLVKRIPNPSGGANYPNMGLIIVAALLLTPSEVLLGVGFGSFLGLLLFWRTEVWRASLNVVMWAMPAAAAALTAQYVVLKGPPGLPSLIVAGCLAVATQRILNMGLFAGYRNLRFGHPFFTDWLQNVIENWPSQLLSAPLAIVVAILAQRLGTVSWGLVLTGASALGLPVARQELAYYFRSQQMLEEIVEAVVRALEGVDPTAREHGDRVSELAVGVGRRFGMSERELQALRLAARLHDVGLLAGTDDHSDAHHAVVGGRILGWFPDPLIAEFVRAHHERWDGTGLPDHKKGDAIPLGARILTATEIYDTALAGHHPFEGIRSQQDAASHLISLAGTVLDPKVVMLVIRVAMEKNADLASAG